MLIRKFNWIKAPEWAKYAAMDNNGDSYWFSDKPQWSGEQWAHSEEYKRVKHEQINKEDINIYTTLNCHNTLEERRYAIKNYFPQEEPDNYFWNK